METKEWEWEDWKDEILQMNGDGYENPLFGVYPLRGGQRDMLLRALPRWVNRRGIRTITRVLKEGEYREEDKELLNEVREWYLGSYSV